MAKKVAKAVNDPRWWLAVGLAMLMTSLFLATSGQITSWEETVLRWTYNLPSVLTPIFLGITFLGSAWAVIAITIFYWLLKKHPLAFHLGLAASAAYLVSAVMKSLVDRPRPAELLSGISSRELFLSTGLGFPSAHSAVSTALALIIMPKLPRNLRWLAPTWILLVALSRLYLGVHAPLDVIGGIGLGLACAGFVIIMSLSKAKNSKITKGQDD